MARERRAEMCGDPSVPFPEDMLYSLEQLQQGMAPGYRPPIPAWHLVDGVIKLTYWHAIKYYCATLTVAHKAKHNCSSEEAKEFVEGYYHFRSQALERVLRYLLEAYPPFVIGVDMFPIHRPWELVRLRTSECPRPAEGEVPWKPYEIKGDQRLLKEEYYGRIYTGEPAFFYSFLMEELIHIEEGLCHLDRLICKGGNIHAWIELSQRGQTMKRSIQEFIDRSEWGEKKIRFYPH